MNAKHMIVTVIVAIAIAICFLILVIQVSAAYGEDWNQYRRDERHSAWARDTIYPPLERVRDIPVRRWRWTAQIPDRDYQLDTVTVFDDTVMLTGGPAGGDPRAAHGYSRWIAYLRRSCEYGDPQDCSQTAPLNIKGLASLRPSATIETDSGHHPCHSGPPWNGIVSSGYLMESGYLKFNHGYAGARYQSDTFGPITCRDDNTELIATSRRQWHGGGMWASRMRMWGAYEKGGIKPGLPATKKLWGQWQRAPEFSEDKHPLGYSIAYDAIYVGDYVVSNYVTSALRPQRLPPNYVWPDIVSGLCVWQIDPWKKLTCREGSFGQLSSDGSSVFTYEQTPYERIPPGGHMEIGGASRTLVELDLKTLDTINSWDIGNLPVEIQDAPLANKDIIVTLAYRNNAMHLEGYQRITNQLAWSKPVPVTTRRGSCAYWPTRYQEQLVLAASGDSVVVASDGITILDVHSGEITWQGMQGVTYFNPAVSDGDLLVIRDDSGPLVDVETGNCSGNALEVWRGGSFAPVSTQTPTPQATKAATNTRTFTATGTLTQTRTSTSTPSRTRTPSATMLAQTNTPKATLTKTRTRTASPTAIPTVTLRKQYELRQNGQCFEFCLSEF